jgi:hypothetical protein
MATHIGGRSRLGVLVRLQSEAFSDSRHLVPSGLEVIDEPRNRLVSEEEVSLSCFPPHKAANSRSDACGEEVGSFMTPRGSLI